jgi:P4 family phage/plasmid primase-like protien
MIIGVQMDHPAQILLRNQIVKKLPSIWNDIPITNTWEEVLDKGISTGETNWQLYGSRKPNHEPYRVTQLFRVAYDEEDGELILKKGKVEEFDEIKNINLLSARYTEHPVFFYKNDFLEKLGNRSNSSSSTTKRPVAPSYVPSPIFENTVCPIIRNAEDLQQQIQFFLDSIQTTEYDLREAYDYTMILPEQYYGVGSYDKWVRVGWVLKNISNRLFIVWLAFSAKASSFQYSSIPEIWEKWGTFNMDKHNGLTKYSLIHWVKLDASPDLYKEVEAKTIDFHIDNTLNSFYSSNSKDSDKRGCGDYDIANVLFQIYKHEYKCVSIKNSIWYRYTNHRWTENESGTTLRKNISTVLKRLYYQKFVKFNAMCLVESENEEPTEQEKKRIETAKNYVSKIGKIMERLVSTNDKKNIMTEAKELFYDEDFLSKLDNDPYLLCCKNGVIDFKLKIFRKGYPEDYLSKTTGVEYIPTTCVGGHAADIHDFMAKLFPVPELRNYMWDHLASTLIGVAFVQTFNMYIGEGKNGKSILAKLMKLVLGEYRGEVPLSLITDRRTKIGGLAPEMVELKGIRYAVMQEPSKGDKINEGVMKQLTSGSDPLQGRAPYMPKMITFIPQFTLVVCSNVFMEIKSQDFGTWRRIRVVDFMSKFVDEPVEGDPENPYQFKADASLEERVDSWKETFLAMLIERAFKTEGRVEDCPMVLASSNSYRESQDSIAEFLRDRIMVDPRGRITKMDVSNEFNMWYELTYGRKKETGVKMKDIYTQMDKKFGKYKTEYDAWIGCRILIAKSVPQLIGDDMTDGDDGSVVSMIESGV